MAGGHYGYGTAGAAGDYVALDGDKAEGGAEAAAGWCSCDLWLKGVALVAAAGAAAKGMLGIVAWLGAVVSAPVAVALPTGIVVGATGVPFYLENVIIGLMAAKLRFDPSYVDAVLAHEFDKDPPTNWKRKLQVLALGGRLTDEYIAEARASYTAHGKVLEVGGTAEELNTSCCGHLTAALGGAAAAIGQAGMVLESPPGLFKEHAVPFAVVVGLANIFTMYPNVLRSKEAFVSLLGVAREGKWGKFFEEFLNLAFSSTAAISNVTGAYAMLADVALRVSLPETLPVSVTMWLFSVLLNAPVIGLNMNATDEFIGKVTARGCIDSTKLGGYLKDNAWGMFSCAVCNALPSSYYTYFAAMGLGGPVVAMLLTAVTFAALVVTKGPSFQRFLEKCWENEHIRACLTCGGFESLESAIERLCCCSSRRGPVGGDTADPAESERIFAVAGLVGAAAAAAAGPEAMDALAGAFVETAMEEGLVLPGKERGGRPVPAESGGARAEAGPAASAGSGWCFFGSRGSGARVGQPLEPSP